MLSKVTLACLITLAGLVATWRGADVPESAEPAGPRATEIEPLSPAFDPERPGRVPVAIVRSERREAGESPPVGPSSSRSGTLAVRLRGFRSQERLALTFRDSQGDLISRTTELSGSVRLDGLPVGTGTVALTYRNAHHNGVLSSTEAEIESQETAVVELDWPEPLREPLGSATVVLHLGDEARELASREPMSLELWGHGDSESQRRQDLGTVRRPLDVLSRAGDRTFYTEIGPLPAGSYRVALRPLGAATDVRVVPGENATASLDVGPLARTIVRLVDERSRPVEARSLRVLVQPEGVPELPGDDGLRPAWSVRTSAGVHEVWSVPGRLLLFVGFDPLAPQISTHEVRLGWNDLLITRRPNLVAEFDFGRELSAHDLTQLEIETPPRARVVDRQLVRAVSDRPGTTTGATTVVRVQVTHPGRYVARLEREDEPTRALAAFVEPQDAQ